MPVSTLSMFSETARTYLTMRIGEITLDPPYTAILIAALAAALLSAFKLWLIGKQEERQARLDALRATVGQRSGAAKPRSELPFNETKFNTAKSHADRSIASALTGCAVGLVRQP